MAKTYFIDKKTGINYEADTVQTTTKVCVTMLADGRFLNYNEYNANVMTEKEYHGWLRGKLAEAGDHLVLSNSTNWGD